MNDSIYKLIDWDDFSKQPLTEHQIECYSEYVDWSWISTYQTLSEPFIEQHQNQVDWELICKHQNLSENFKQKHLTTT